jgi:hypothetical protein
MAGMAGLVPGKSDPIWDSLRAGAAQLVELEPLLGGLVSTRPEFTIHLLLLRAYISAFTVKAKVKCIHNANRQTPRAFTVQASR